MIPYVRLGDLATTLQGRVPARTTDDQDGQRFFGMAEISGHQPRVVEPQIDLSGALYLEPGDVVVALLGEVGKSAMVDRRSVGAVLGRECAVLRVTAEDRVLSAWLYAWTQSPHFKTQIAQHVSGATMPRVSVRALKEFVLPLPPLPQQHELADRIDVLNAILAAMTQMVRDLEDLRGAELQLAVGKVLPA